MLLALVADLEWLAGGELYWTLAAGLVVATLALVFGSQLFGRSPAREDASPPQDRQSPEQVDPFAAGGSSERRNAMRRKGSSVALRLTDVKQTYPDMEGWVLDRSVSGLGVVVDRQVEAGTILRVRPENAPPMTPLLDIEVRSCKVYETDWLLGCVFVKTPPYSVLMMFG